MCHTGWARDLFEPAIRKLPKEAARAVSISKNAFVALCVISAGMDAGSRVVDLSSPLALAGIPIFFITTYYSDFILVPAKDRQSVVQALFARGFVFSEGDSSFVSPPLSHVRGASASSEPPSTPPPTNVAELQVRTFELLKKRRVVPRVDPELHLVHCSGRRVPSQFGGGRGEFTTPHRPSVSRTQSGVGGKPTWVDSVDTKLYACLTAALAGRPRFLSVTLVEDDPPSLLLDKALIPLFSDSLVGDREGDLVPILLDLVNLPFEATGIVSGVAGKLVSEMRLEETPELSYHSTSKAGAVILDSARAARAMAILKPLLPPAE